MGRMPGASWEPLASNWSSQPRMVAHNFVCIHTMVGSLEGTDSYFRWGNGTGYDGTESHYGTGYDGRIEQWQDTAHQAEANLNGNGDVISIENADVGTGFPAWNLNDGSQVPAFTAAQVESIAGVLAWECSPAAHAGCPTNWACHGVGIPLALVPDTKPGRRGVAYHRQGVDPYRASGGTLWSRAYGKVCPGDRRIAQIPKIIARARELMDGDDMPTLDEIRAAIREEVGAALIAPSPGGIGGTSPRALSSMIGRGLDDTYAGKEHAAETRRMLGVILGWRAPATEGERSAVEKLWGGAVDVDEKAVAASLTELIRPMLLEAVQAGMAADNADQADVIVDRLAQRLGSAT